MGPLYDAVAFGMWTYTHAAFRVHVLAPRRFRLAPGTLIVSTHRRETDVPLICPPLYFGARLWRNRPERMSFSARDDMFLPGFFAGFPPGLSPRIRRLLYPLGVGKLLRQVHVYPISSASLARAGELLRHRPDAPLGDILPAEIVIALGTRAAELGRAAPSRGRDVLRGEYADVLWRAVTREEAPALDDYWAGRAARSTADFRGLVDLLRAGGSLVVFPEGEPSPDGAIGPLKRGLSALVRRGRPSSFLPIALAYDPLSRGRTRVTVALGSRIEPPSDLEAATLALLRVLTPLSCGQLVAHEILAGRSPDAPTLADAVEEARARGRPVEPDLLDPKRRRTRLAEALAAAEAKPSELSFLAREYASARTPA